MKTTNELEPCPRCGALPCDQTTAQPEPSGDAVERACKAFWKDMLRTGQANDLRDWIERSGEDDGWKWHSPALDEKTKANLRSAMKAALAAMPLLDEDELEQIIADSFDVDWNPRDAAKAIIEAMQGKG